MTDELRVRLTQAIEQLTPLFQAATRHGFTRDADTLQSIRKCRDSLSTALSPEATEDELRLALTLTAELGLRLFAAVKPGGRA